MNIGILTFHFSDNYGALLQAYALRRWLISCGHKADFVNYHPDYVEAGGNFSRIFSPSRAKANLKIAYLKLTHLRIKYFGSKEASMAMDAFRRDKLGVGGPAFKDDRSLQENSHQYDLLICGSDQIWNPSEQFGVDPIYFLDFKSSAKRKISYAASFGSSDVKQCYQEEIRSLLMKLDGLSVREEKAVDFVERLTGKRPVCVPDPTFLLDDYSEILDSAKKPTEEHVFSYVLRSGEGFSEIAAALNEKLKIKIISAHNPHRRWKDIGESTTGGVTEWLGNLNSSRLVLTNSFHATVFSILLNRPFIAVSLPGARAKLSDRLVSLLSKTKLSERMIVAGDVAAAKRLADTPIDWEIVNAAVAELRGIGRDYLASETAQVRL